MGGQFTPAPITAPPALTQAPDVPRPAPTIPQAPPAAVVPLPELVGVRGQDEKNPQPQPPKTTPEQIAEYTKLETRERIFSLPDDATLEKYVRMRMVETALKQDPPIKLDESKLQFPELPDVGGGKPYVAKTVNYPPMRAQYDALYVVHRRLHFEDKNTERYGWDLGIVQPLVSAALFYKDVFLWPQSLASGCAYGFWDTNAGKCLPGSPTPYMLYPPGLTITGGAFEGVIITGVAFAIP